MKGVPEPVNTTEAYLYAMTVRLDALCNMVSSLIESKAESDNVAVTNNTEEKTDTRCIANTKSGNRCKSKVVGDTEYCATHTKDDK